MQTVMDVLIVHLKDKIASLEAAVSGGSLQDYAAYKEQCGYIRGLYYALKEAQDLKHKLEKDDD